MLRTRQVHALPSCGCRTPGLPGTSPYREQGSLVGRTQSATQCLVLMRGRRPCKWETIQYHGGTDMTTTAAPTMLVSCTARVDLPCPCKGQPWGASLGSPFPLLAQEVLELLYQLLRVEVIVTQGARRLVTRRVIVLL
jgi:hypothetical protein